jgi:hypothetical protein
MNVLEGEHHTISLGIWLFLYVHLAVYHGHDPVAELERKGGVKLVGSSLKYLKHNPYLLMNHSLSLVVEELTLWRYRDTGKDKQNTP